MNPRRILVAVDFLAADSDEALALAAMLVAAQGGALVLLHVLAPASSMSGIVPGARGDRDLDVARDAALAQLDALARPLRDGGIADVSAIVEIGYPVERILDHARLHAIELIVLGTHGRSGLPRIWMGSVAELVLRQAPCRVIVVRGPAGAAHG